MKILHNTTKYVLLFVALLLGVSNMNAQASSLKSNLLKEAMVEAVNAGRLDYNSGMDYNSYTQAIGVDQKELTANENALLTDVFNYIKTNASDSQIRATYNGNSLLNCAKEKGTPFSSATNTQKGFFSRIIRALQATLIFLQELADIFGFD